MSLNTGAEESGERCGESVPQPNEDLPDSTSSPLLHFRSASPVAQADLPLPVWLRESSKSFHWRWVPLPLRKVARAVLAWSKGPDPPRIQKISPFFPSIQEAPIRLLDRFAPKRKHKAGLLIFFYFCWILTFSLVLHHSASAGEIGGYGQPSPIWCGASYWAGGNGCGMNGNNCRPFANATFAFRCPANCGTVKVLNPHAVGDQEMLYRPLVIGGPEDDGLGLPASEPIYRGDSSLCQAAIHAGVVSRTRGGCGVVSLVGEHHHYPGTRRNGIESTSFDASFPKSFTFISGIPSSCVSDLRWPLLAITITFTSILSIFTTSPAIFFFSIFTMLFLHVGLVSDPPNISDYPSLTSLCIGRLLPATFTAYVLYRYCVRRPLTDLTAQLEKTTLWLGGAWIGALNNYTFDFIPIQRLTPHDLAAQPGARLALSLIITLIALIALGQIYYLRLEGRLPTYLALYAAMASFLLLCVAVPNLNLRIHHYVLALLLLPGTAIQTRPSLLYQGILVGLFVNGVARWDFDSILQTPAALLGSGAQVDSLLPNVTDVLVGAGAANISFAWRPPPSGRLYDGVSVLVNDVERGRWYVGEGDAGFTWGRKAETKTKLVSERGPETERLGNGEWEWEKVYFRFAYMSGSQTADYTKAGVWQRNGTWTRMRPGPS